MAKTIIAENTELNTQFYEENGVYYVDEGVGSRYVISRMCASRKSGLRLFATTTHHVLVGRKNLEFDEVRKSACHSCGLAAAGLTGSCTGCPMYKIATELQKTFKREKKFIASLIAEPADKMV